MVIVKRNLLGDTVSKKLRKAIISGEYPDGYHLAEPNLAAELGVSRGPVRDALQLLVREGFAERLPNGRVSVRAFGIQDIRNLFEFRVLLETMAAEKWIADESSSFPHDDFREILGQMAKKTITSEEFSEWDMRFHKRIVELSDNKSLLQSWNGLEDVIKSILEITNHGNPRADAIRDHHDDIIQAIRERDVFRAKDSIGYHLKEAEQVMIASLRRLMKSG